MRPLLAPLAFLLAAVPFAVLLDRLGLFEAVAARLPARPGVLWVVAAVVTAVLNLDTSVVLLTPIYARIDRRLAFQPVLLALVASSFLPVSNLTNLLAASGGSVGTGDVLRHLAPAGLAATVVAWFAYRRRCFPSGSGQLRGQGPRTCPQPEVDRVAAGVVVVVVAGFVVGLAPWAVVLAGTVVLAWRARWVPWRSVPVTTAAGVLAVGAVVTALVDRSDLHRLAHPSGPLGVAGVAVVAAVAANLVNNLPATLVAVRGIGHAPGLWPALVGVNMGPFVLVSGSLASLLWLRSTQSLGLGTSAREFTRTAVPVVGPAFAAAVTVTVLLR